MIQGWGYTSLCSIFIEIVAKPAHVVTGRRRVSSEFTEKTDKQAMVIVFFRTRNYNGLRCNCMYE